MSEITTEEIWRRVRIWAGLARGKSSWCKEDDLTFWAVRSLVENMVVSREFVEDWAKSIAGDLAINDVRRVRAKVKSLINQLGHEVEEEK